MKNISPLHMMSSLKKYEETIETGIKGYIEAGKALEAIKSKKLYKGAYGTYDEYCRERWGFSPQHSNRLITAAKLADEIQKTEPTGSVLPQSESQARALSKTDNPVSVWKEAQIKTGKHQPSAKEIAAVSQKTTDVIDAEIVESVNDTEDAFWASFSKLLDHTYKFNETIERKQIAIDTDNESVERLDKLKKVTGYTKGAIVSQALCLYQEIMELKNREISSQK